MDVTFHLLPLTNKTLLYFTGTVSWWDLLSLSGKNSLDRASLNMYFLLNYPGASRGGSRYEQKKLRCPGD